MCSMLMVRQCCGVQCRVTCTRSLMHACCRISTFHKESWIKDTVDTVNFLLILITDFLVTQIGNEVAGWLHKMSFYSSLVQAFFFPFGSSVLCRTG